MSWMYGEDYAYAATRLDGTIVTHNNKPFYVRRILQEGVAHGHYLDNCEDRLDVPAKELELIPVKLGYVNQGGVAGYISRMPMRRDWRQGLRAESMVCVDKMLDKRHILEENLHNTIVGNYPTFKAVLEVIGNVDSMAWSRHWALTKGKKLCYKGEVVGGIKLSMPVLGAKFQHLKEYLEEVL